MAKSTHIGFIDPATKLTRQLDPGDLIDQLGSVSLARRLEAVRQLRALGGRAVEPLVSRLTHESRSRRHNWLRSLGLACAGTVFYIWLAPRLTNPAFWPLLLAFLPITLVIMRWNAWSRLQIQAARLLTQIDDVRAVGPLADALESRDLWVVSSTRALAAEALVRLLPQLTAADGELLNQAQRRSLYHSLEHAGMYDADLTRAVIRVIRLIGDETAERPLIRLIENRYFIGRNSELDVEAEEALKAIRARLLQARETEMLLRPAEGLDVPEQLLRAAEGSTDVRFEQLLRSVSGISNPTSHTLQQSAEETDAVCAGAEPKGFADSGGDVCITGANTEVNTAFEIRSTRQ